MRKLASSGNAKLKEEAPLMGDGCPKCGSPLPSPLGDANFCKQCQFPLRFDSWERARRAIQRHRGRK